MRHEMHQGKDDHFIPMTSFSSGSGHEPRPGIYYYTNQIVNVIMVGEPGKGEWVLIDTGMPRCGKEIVSVAEKRFGKNNPPACILLTHGHFDHVGGIVHLVETWTVPVYAHRDEFPFLTGKQAYPHPDTTVQGGILAKISSIYPVEPVNIEGIVQPLPLNGSVPSLPGWKWIHVPGHSPGQVAFFREADGVLLSADAFITVRQDSFYKVLVQQKEINGPPRYLTVDWQAAWDSVRRLEALHPSLAITGHGKHMEGA